MLLHIWEVRTALQAPGASYLTLSTQWLRWYLRNESGMKNSKASSSLRSRLSLCNATLNQRRMSSKKLYSWCSCDTLELERAVDISFTIPECRIVPIPKRISGKCRKQSVYMDGFFPHNPSCPQFHQGRSAANKQGRSVLSSADFAPAPKTLPRWLFGPSRLKWIPRPQHQMPSMVALDYCFSNNTVLFAFEFVSRPQHRRINRD